MSMNQHQIITSENLASICKLDFSLQSKKKKWKRKISSPSCCFNTTTPIICGRSWGRSSVTEVVILRRSSFFTSFIKSFVEMFSCRRSYGIMTYVHKTLNTFTVWLCVIVMSSICFRVNLHSIVAWMPRNSWHPCSKQAQYLKFKSQQRDSKPQPLSS